MALSGKYLSPIYLVESLTADSIASSVIFTLWWASYLSLMPLSISIASSCEGSSTITGWKRRSKAASFSMCLRYSSIVVAPIIWSSPLAREGFKILAASAAPSALPAPIRVWTSSMKRITSLAFLTSSITFLILSSKSPRYFVPATIPVRSREYIFLSFKSSGTSPETILRASPSAIAVLPTPGSPIRQGLFLVRLERIWITLSISFWRPITGSILPSFASFVRSLPNCESILSFSLPPSLLSVPAFAVPPIRAFDTSFTMSCMETPARLKRSVALHEPSRAIASNTCSVPTSCWPICLANATEVSRMFLLLGVKSSGWSSVGTPTPMLLLSSSSMSA